MLVELRNIRKSYNKHSDQGCVLNGLNLIVDHGEMVAIMGKSGCGKSTLLNVMGCITDLTDGEYIYNNQKIDMRNKKEMNDFRKKNIGFIVQDFALLNEKTVFQNVELPLLVRKVKMVKRREQVNEYLEMIGLEDKLDCYPNQLSGGEQQRVAIARALISHPKVILADEPTGSLDEENTVIILTILKKIAANGTAVILVTHDRDVAEQCSRCVTISNGRIALSPVESRNK